METNFVVYTISNRVNGKRYIGKTSKGIRVRWTSHKSDARGGKKTYFHKAIRKHGEENFDIRGWIALGEGFTAGKTRKQIDEALSALETIQIRLAGTRNPERGYNLTEGGEGTTGHTRFKDDERKLRLKSEVVRLYLNGKTPKWIGAKFGLSDSPIRNWLIEWGIKRRSPGEAQSLKQIGNKKSKYNSEIIRLYLNGKSSEWIGKKFGLSPNTILNWLKEWEIKIRPCGEGVSLAYIGNKKSKYKTEIIRLYLSGKSSLLIGRKFGLTYGTILVWLREWKIPIRKRGRQKKFLTLVKVA